MSEYTTNIVESARAYSQRTGKHLTLVGSIMQGEKIDKQYFELQSNVHRFGVTTTYGNKNITGRVSKNLNRQKTRTQKAKKTIEKELQGTERILMEAKSLIEAGVSTQAIEEFLKAKTKSS